MEILKQQQAGVWKRGTNCEPKKTKQKSLPLTKYVNLIESCNKPLFGKEETTVSGDEKQTKTMVDAGGCGLFLQWGVRWFLGGTSLFGLK